MFHPSEISLFNSLMAIDSNVVRKYRSKIQGVLSYRVALQTHGIELCSTDYDSTFNRGWCSLPSCMNITLHIWLLCFMLIRSYEGGNNFYCITGRDGRTYFFLLISLISNPVHLSDSKQHIHANKNTHTHSLLHDQTITGDPMVTDHELGCVCVCVCVAW